MGEGPGNKLQPGPGPIAQPKLFCSMLPETFIYIKLIKNQFAEMTFICFASTIFRLSESYRWGSEVCGSFYRFFMAELIRAAFNIDELWIKIASFWASDSSNRGSEMLGLRGNEELLCVSWKSLHNMRTTKLMSHGTCTLLERRSRWWFSWR